MREEIDNARRNITRLELFAMDCEDQSIEELLVNGFYALSAEIEKIVAIYVDIPINADKKEE